MTLIPVDVVITIPSIQRPRLVNVPIPDRVVPGGRHQVHEALRIQPGQVLLAQEAIPRHGISAAGVETKGLAVGSLDALVGASGQGHGGLVVAVGEVLVRGPNPLEAVHVFGAVEDAGDAVGAD